MAMASCCGRAVGALVVPSATVVTTESEKQVSGVVCRKVNLQFSGLSRTNLKQVKGYSFNVRASTAGVEGPSEDASDEPVVTTTATATLVKEVENSVEDLKQALVDSLYGTDRGLRASSETRGEIVELITQLEAKSPTAVPTEALTLLNAKWVLATSATFEGRSPKRVQVKFEEGIIGTPQLTDSIETPDSVEVLDQKVDLVAFQSVFRPLQDATSALARTISGQPPFKFPFQSDRAQSWLLTTYLDGDLRISRGDSGSIFVLIKEGSTLLET